MSGWYQLYKPSERWPINYAWADNAILATSINNCRIHFDWDLSLFCLVQYWVFSPHIPTTPNTFLISGTKMAIISTTPTMVRVATMWIGQEKGRLPKSSKRTALRACSTRTNKRSYLIHIITEWIRILTKEIEVKWSGVFGLKRMTWWEQCDCYFFFLKCKHFLFAHQNLYFPKVHYLIAIKNKMRSMGFIFLIQRSVYLRGTGSAARSAKQRVGWPIERSSPTCHEVNTCRSQAAARTPREL